MVTLSIRDYSLPKQINKNRSKRKSLFKCSRNERHKLTFNQAKSSKGFCTHCGSKLKAYEEFKNE